MTSELLGIMEVLECFMDSNKFKLAIGSPSYNYIQYEFLGNWAMPSVNMPVLQSTCAAGKRPNALERKYQAFGDPRDTQLSALFSTNKPP